MNRDKLMICAFIAIAIGIIIYFQKQNEDARLLQSIKPTQEVIKKANRPRIINFTATWCGACQQFKPVLKSIMSNYYRSVDCDILDVDKKENLPLVHSFNVRGIPATFIFDRRGNLLFKQVGYIDPDKLDNYLRRTIR